jgi:hypothetical protein
MFRGRTDRGPLPDLMVSVRDNPMNRTDLPDELVTFLRSNSPATLEAAHYETVTLIPVEELRIETLEVTPNLAPFARDHPHVDDYGHYAVPAINLVRGGRSDRNSFPAWLFLWLPDEWRYGSYDLDHGDLMVYAPEVTWSQIAADPEPFVHASDGGRDGPVTIEYLQPWPRYAFVKVESSD